MIHFESGDVIESPGKTFRYRAIGACCQLFDRESLPYLKCNLRGKFKEPSWNRIGKRFVPDRSVRHRASYNVVLEGFPSSKPRVIIYWKELSREEKEWWYAPLTPKNKQAWSNAA